MGKLDLAGMTGSLHRLLSSRRLDGLSSEQVVSEFKIQRTEATRPFEALLRSCNNNSIEFSVG